MADLNIVVTGAAGRMGISIVRAISQKGGMQVGAALERAGSQKLGADIGVLAGLGPLGVNILDDVDKALADADAIIDFSAPAASVALAKKAAQLGLIHIIGTTGCSEKQQEALNQAADAGARIVKSGNMSLGINLLAALVKKAAIALNEDFDIEIVEMHHNQKVDAPSGTALMLGEAAAKLRKIDLETHAVKAREGDTGARQSGTIGFATLRGGTVVGEHKVIFAGPSERIELAHIAQDRSLFAEGAIKAVLWARDKKPGYYTMDDVLGLDR